MYECPSEGPTWHFYYGRMKQPLICLESKTVQGTEHTKPTQQTDQTYADYVHNA